jgi:hypothetical protein
MGSRREQQPWQRLSQLLLHLKKLRFLKRPWQPVRMKTALSTREVKEKVLFKPQFFDVY